MTREEAINYNKNLKMYMKITDKQNPCKFLEGNYIALDMAIEALKERPHGNWEYLKEHITEMRDADGKLNQKQTCQFILNLIGVIEKEGEAE